MSAGKGKGREDDEVIRLTEEISSIEDQIKSLQDLKKSLVAQRERRLSNRPSTASGPSLSGSAIPATSSLVDYTKNSFDWSDELLPRAKATWGIESFRSCQEAVCNAALDGRDVVCVMPTGGGKSLCYQLPAILSVGLTLVVSPLISLSTDQCWHLREANIACEMMHSGNTREESTSILQRVKMAGTSPKDRIKVLFVTPERVVKSKTLLASLQKCYERDQLARIVIDEAHCCSQMGHDFRPNYKKLAILRKIYPGVPIMCLSATLSPRVLGDVRNILGLPPTVDPIHAMPNKTVYFTAPLHRPNLHYKVLNRPSLAKDANEAIAKWIEEHHAGHSGIVYALSRSDTQKMADALNEISQGRIRAGVYHADLEDAEKKRIHHHWRDGRIKVVVATIAFGMGIDKGDVRFVIHACISKSIDSYYQETGRAGRDGQDADCVLFYRPADEARISGMVAGEPTGQEKLRSMLSYAQSTRCRKCLFGDYFEDRFGNDGDCGTCDNCTFPLEEHDLTLEAWKTIKVMEEVYDEGGRITLAGLADLVRGLGGGQYTVVDSTVKKRAKDRKGAKAKQSGFVDLDATCGGKVVLSKDNTERMCIELLLKNLLADEFNATAYSVNVYVRPGRDALRLSRLSLDEVQTRSNMVKVTLTDKKKGAGTKRTKRAGPSSRSGAEKEEDDAEAEEEVQLNHKRSRKSGADPAPGGNDVKEGEEAEEDGWQVLHTTWTAMSDPIEIDSD